MSLSMWLWRVIIPGAGLAACVAVGWQSIRPERPLKGAGVSKAKPSEDVRKVTDRVIAEGRVAARPGALVTVGTELGGLILTLPAREKLKVKKGDLLVGFRGDDRLAALAEAESKLAECEAEVEFQKREYQRRVKASTDSKTFAADVDTSRRDYEVALARKRGATAGVAHAKLTAAHSRVTSPIDGVVLACPVEAGETVGPGTKLVTVGDLSRTRIEAEVDEFDAPKIAVGAEVFITTEGQAGPPLRGTVEEIPDRVAERSLRPDDPGRPSDTRVLLVKIAPARPLTLRIGQQVEVEIRVGAATAVPVKASSTRL